MALSSPSLPNRLVMRVAHLDAAAAYRLAVVATSVAQRLAPKLSGAAAASLTPYAADGEFGISWPSDMDYLWFQEKGVKAFTMRSLAGKTIPMWIDDPTGRVARDNPKAETRITASGRRQVKIFRRAAKIGQTKQQAVRTRRGGVRQVRTVPASYPGAPGRIARREHGRPHTTAGRRGGAVATRNVGVRWRFPGIEGRGFLHHALQTAARRGAVSGRIMAGYEAAD